MVSQVAVSWDFILWSKHPIYPIWSHAHQPEDENRDAYCGVTLFKFQGFCFLGWRLTAHERSWVLTWTDMVGGTQMRRSGCCDRGAYTPPLCAQSRELPAWPNTHEQRHLQINKPRSLGPCHAFVLLNKVNQKVILISVCPSYSS